MTTSTMIGWKMSLLTASLIVAIRGNSTVASLRHAEGDEVERLIGGDPFL